MNSFSLQSKTILVTGASSGIGRQTAIECSLVGAKVILVGRDVIRLEETRALMSTQEQHQILQLDITHEEDAQLTFSENLKNQKIDGIVHCAGASTTLPLRAMTSVKTRQFFDVNVFGALTLTKLLTKPAMIPESGCSIVFISSVMSVAGEAGKTIYSATKGALVSAARSLAIELAPRGIRVNCISPGVVVSPMSTSAVYSQDEESLAKIKAMHPLGFGDPKDVAYACIYLLADASRWTTGSNLIVDGGYTAR